MKICKNCKRKIKFLQLKYSFNDGIYCDNCFEIGLLKQHTNTLIDNIKLKINKL